VSAVDSILVSGLMACLGCLGYCLIFNVHGLNMLIAALGGALGWLVFLLGEGLPNDLVRYFLATLALSIYAQIMARVRKAPATVFLIIALLPLVPGSGIYHTMEFAIAGKTDQFIKTGLHTLAIAGSLSIGIILISSIARLASTIGKGSA
jgi:uncharacterized membrane protein YjjB (DUF3815 family)